MRDQFMQYDDNDAPPPRRLTGRMVLFCLLGFFGVVFGVNGILIHEALSTFGGVDTDSAYQAGQMFEHDVAMAKAQDALQWRVEAKVTPMPDGARRVDVVARDAAGRPVRGMTLSAVFERPIDRRLDRGVTVTEDAPGRFHGSAEIAPGQWDLVIELSRQGDRQFRSRNRVVLK
jgi:nitrogen fixation protein FixH